MIQGTFVQVSDMAHGPLVFFEMSKTVSVFLNCFALTIWPCIRLINKNFQ